MTSLRLIEREIDIQEQYVVQLPEGTLPLQTREDPMIFHRIPRGSALWECSVATACAMVEEALPIEINEDTTILELGKSRSLDCSS